MYLHISFVTSFVALPNHNSLCSTIKHITICAPPNTISYWIISKIELYVFTHSNNALAFCLYFYFPRSKLPILNRNNHNEIENKLRMENSWVKCLWFKVILNVGIFEGRVEIIVLFSIDFLILWVMILTDIWFSYKEIKFAVSIYCNYNHWKHEILFSH